MNTYKGGPDKIGTLRKEWVFFVNVNTGLFTFHSGRNEMSFGEFYSINLCWIGYIEIHFLRLFFFSQNYNVKYLKLELKILLKKY